MQPPDSSFAGVRAIPAGASSSQLALGDGRAAALGAIAARMTPSKPERGVSSLSAEDLIRACIDTGNTAAWEEFVRRTHGVMAATVLRTARRFGETSPALIADLVQESYLRVCENRCRALRDFRSGHPDAIFGLVRTIAFSVTQDHFRAGLAHKRGAGRGQQPMDSVPEIHLAGGDESAAIERRILLGEIDRFLEGGRSERRIFWLYFRHGLTSRDIAALPGIGLSQKGVESTIHRVTARVKEWLSTRGGDENAKGKSTGSAL